MLEHVEPAGHTQRAVNELQGLNISLITGGALGAKLDIAALRSTDTIIAVHDNTAGVFTDVKALSAISDLRASGTLTLAVVVDLDTAVVNGITYTFSTSPSAEYNSVLLGASDTESAANLAAAINGVEGSAGKPNVFFATSAANVVTITARAEGTDGNAVTTVGSATITASGATLAGGSATGGIEIAVATGQVTLYWFNKG